MYQKFSILTLITSLFVSLTFAQESEKGSIQRAGDVILVTLPAWAIGSSLDKGDEEGGMMWFKSLGVNALVTFGLKKAIDKERPDQSDEESFPSAHTSMTFHSATYLHVRYGFQAAEIPYLAATFTAFSRVYAKKHFLIDVVAGALIGSASAYFLTDNHSDYSSIPHTDKNRIKSRPVQAQQSLNDDVVAGALIGSSALYFLTDHTSKYSLTPYVDKARISLKLKTKF